MFKHKKHFGQNFLTNNNIIKKIAEIAQQSNHHPTIKNTFNTVEIWLETHESNNQITDKDRKMSAQIDRLDHSQKIAITTPSKAQNFSRAVLFCDGGSRGNPGPSASGYVLYDRQENEIERGGEYLGITTNNQAEYQALKLGIVSAQKFGISELQVYMDSLLVINQMRGVFKVKNRDLWPIFQDIKQITKNFKFINFGHVPRERNKVADSEVNKVLDAQVKKSKT